MCTPRVSPSVHCGLVGDCSKGATLGVLVVGEAVLEECGKSLYLSLNFPVNLKLFQKMNST